MKQDLDKTPKMFEKLMTYQLPDVITVPQAHAFNDGLGLALGVVSSLRRGKAAEDS